MVMKNGAVLEEKLANKFFEMVDVAPEDWEIIRERWASNKATTRSPIGSLNSWRTPSKSSVIAIS